MEALAPYHLDEIKADLIAEKGVYELGKFGAIGQELVAKYSGRVQPENTAEKTERILGTIDMKKVYATAEKWWDGLKYPIRNRVMIQGGATGYEDDVDKSYAELMPVFKGVVNAHVKAEMAAEIVNKAAAESQRTVNKSEDKKKYITEEWVWDSLVAQGSAYDALKDAGYTESQIEDMVSIGDISWDSIKDLSWKIDPAKSQKLELQLLGKAFDDMDSDQLYALKTAAESGDEKAIRFRNRVQKFVEDGDDE